MTRIYPITAAELIMIREIMKEYGDELGCSKCGDDLCEHCQSVYDLRKRFVDAASLAEVGVRIVFTNDGDMLDSLETIANKQEAIQ